MLDKIREGFSVNFLVVNAFELYRMLGMKKWWPNPDLNRGPADYETA